jgi:septum formation protein|tara:strand:+ start:153 stop:782 length:630 start_codon:yes stop_codon:yes gene_type:complete
MPLILLASASERRRQILSEHLKDQDACLEFYILREPEQEVSGVMEVNLQVESSCIRKAMAAAKEKASEGENVADIILVSDTLVEDPDDERAALGKPKDESSAAFSLIRLSGRRHRVWSSTAIISRKTGDIDVGDDWLATIWTDYAIVEFEQMEEDEIIDLINSRSWDGKAGGYDLAGDAGKFARVIDGEEVTVLGFSNRAIDSLSGFLN